MRNRLIVSCLAVLTACLASLSIAAAGRSDVADAAARGDKAALRKLLQQNAGVNAVQADGTSALHWAVQRDDVEMADLLIRAGANVKAANRIGITPMYMAALYGNPAMLDRLVKAGADALERGPSGETMLMLAARNGNPDAVRVLLLAGADVNAKESVRGTTALMWAVEQKHPNAVRVLIEAGADFDARAGGAGNPRNYMAGPIGNNNAGARTAMLRLCIQENGGPSIEEQAKQGGGRGATAATAVVEGPCAQYAPGARGNGGGGGGPRGQSRNAGAGANAGGAAAADNNAEDEGPVAGLVGTGGGGLTPLILASRENDIESAKLLIAAGADINRTSNALWTPLLIATNNRNYQLARMLIDHGADVNIANTTGFTPLYLATDNRNIEGGDFPVPKPDMDHLEFIRILLAHGASPNARAGGNTETRTIFTMQWFFEAGATPFVRAAQSGDVTLMKLLLSYGADPTIAANSGDTALAAAAGMGWVEGVTYEWSREESFEAAKMLLDLGLAPNSANVDGRTPLMAAALKGRKEVVQLLVDRGADLDQRDKGSRDTVNANAVLAGHTWRAVDYADGLVRVGVQSAVTHPEVGALIRQLMTDRGMEIPAADRVIDSICIVEICRERWPDFLNKSFE